MKKLQILVYLSSALVLAACGDNNKPAPKAAASTSTASAPAASAKLPPACQDYLDTVSACVSKAGGSAAANAMQQSVDQTKAAWSNLGAHQDALDAACKQAADAIKPQLAAMHC
jgi:cytochrome c556